MHDAGLNLKLKRKSNVMIMTSISLLLMSFFVALAALSSSDDRKSRFGINSIASGFGMPSGEIETTGAEAVSNTAELREALSSSGIVKGTGLYSSNVGTTLAIKSDMLFEAESHVIKQSYYVKLDRIAELIKDLPNDIIITGFTDSRPVETPPYYSNWVLSAARAMSVMDYMASRGILVNRMRAYGMGPEHPIAPNSTVSGRSINSRIEISLAGALPGETETKVKGIVRENNEAAPVYRYKGFDIPLDEKQ